MSATFTDIFCGAGGSSIGLAAAGFELRLAANHWDRAIETHSANFRDAEHLLADVSNYDMRRLPRTDVLWASPECTWHSPAGGRRRLRAQLDLFDDHVPTDGGIRSRATALDVVRAAEVHRYPAVVVENVIEFADWPLYDWWISGMGQLGYRAQTLCVNSAHVGGEANLHAPQWRDRIYVVFTRTEIPAPDLELRPPAWCPMCEVDVAAVQSWKNERRRRIGKYRQQYVYRCPNTACRHAVIEPYVLPAAAAIDWADLGQRIGDRTRPLAEATLRRIRAGLEMFTDAAVVAVGGNTWERPGSDYVRAWPAHSAPFNVRTGTPGDGLACPPFLVDRRFSGGPDGPRVKGVDEPVGTVTAGGQTCRVLVVPPYMVNVNHHGDDGRPYPADEAPLAPRTTRIGDGLVCPPFVALLRNNQAAASVDEPLSVVTAGGRHHGLTIPPGAFIQKHHGGLDYARIEHMTKSVEEPLAAVVAKPNLSLVIPYRRGAAKTTDEPLHTLGTRESAALVRPAIEVDDCHFRMLKPREHLRAQRFPDSYDVKGNKGEQTMQAGNAVSANVAQWIGERVAAALDGREAG